jgi:hypothetical protein
LARAASPRWHAVCQAVNATNKNDSVRLMVAS